MRILRTLEMLTCYYEHSAYERIAILADVTGTDELCRGDA